MADKKEEKKVESMKIDDLTSRVAAESVRADNAESQRDEAQSRVDKAEGERDGLRVRIEELEKEAEIRADEEPEKLKAQVKALVGKISDMKKEHMDALSPEVVRKLVKTRVALETAAHNVLGDEERFDDIDDRPLMEKVIARLSDVEIPEGKSDDYVTARFDAAILGNAQGSAALAKVRVEIAEAAGDEKARNDSQSSREKFLDRQDSAWQAEAS